MFGIKTKILTTFEKKREESFRKNIRVKGLSFFQRKMLLFFLEKKLSFENNTSYIQAPISQWTNPLYRELIKKLNAFNPNNLGNWSREVPHHLSSLLEKNVISQMIQLYHAEKKDLGGYITSGGTEGNIYALWLGRNFLKNFFKREQLIVIQTSLTHYSVKKAADLTDVEITETSLESKSWGMSPELLEETILSFYRKGKKGFLIPLTFGYTITGSDDPVKQICFVLEKIKKSHSDIQFFVWIDAAFSGIVKPFIQRDFSPFTSPLIQAFITDFHKFPAVPYSAGLVLYKKNLLKNIEKNVSYIRRKDTTLLGSRSGMAAITLWYIFQSLGKSGFTKLIDQALKKKRKFTEEILKNSSGISIITTPESVQIGILPQNQKQERILQKKKLYPEKETLLVDGRKKKVIIYKVFFLPFFK